MIDREYYNPCPLEWLNEHVEQKAENHDKFTPSGGVGFLQNLEPPGAQGTAQRKHN